jgi:tagatose-1,6-bisphosphate aldolase
LLKELEIPEISYQNFLGSLRSEIKRLQGFEAIIIRGRAAHQKLLAQNPSDDPKKKVKMTFLKYDSTMKLTKLTPSKDLPPKVEVRRSSFQENQEKKTGFLQNRRNSEGILKKIDTFLKNSN